MLAARATVLARGAGEALVRGDGSSAESALDALVALAPGPAELRIVQQAIIDLLRTAIRAAWKRGWQPRDVYEVLGRGDDRLATELAGDVMADDLAGYARPLVDPRWFEQLSGIGASVWWPADSTWPRARSAASSANASSAGWALVLEAAVGLLGRLNRLGTLQAFLPLPGHASATAAPPAHVDDSVLHRVRQMLAQAESTSFEAEADSFTAAAQRLMARYSIDQAMLAATGQVGPATGPTGRRIWVARPYVKEKVVLLNEVADANRARAVWAKELDMVSLLGHEPDLDAVETLYTSLLVQATRAMYAEGKQVASWGGSGTRGFRQSFLAAYALRIGERLRAASVEETQAAAAEATRQGGRALVPILQAREEAVDGFTEELFPGLVHHRVSAGSDPQGWAKGRQAADRAELADGTGNRLGR
ncbi:DUF2786 domain-containing protein [Raineyella antarctica]|uniref:DUF2786 domain-containing protein n=1 Tax=Raineyella antarctica TaxID=1577474 RepID=UPI001114AEBD|nr:DUF2786 domain-containing protein [Raineyella antarctica]